MPVPQFTRPLLVSRRNGVGERAVDLYKSLILDRIRHDETQIVNGRVVIFGEKTMRIGKMAVRAADLRGFFIHHIREAFDAPADRLGDDDCTVVAGCQQETVEDLPQGQFFACFKSDMAGRGVDAVFRVFRDRDFHVQVFCIFDGHDRGQDLGRTGRINSGVGILII